MKILIDIGHPAHVHYFKNFIFKMISSGNQVKLIARDKEVTLVLLDKYKLDYVNRGKGGDSLFQKLIYYPYAVYKFMIESYKFKPDFFLALSSIYLPLTSFLFNKPLVTVDDTEHAFLSHIFYKNLSSIIFTPKYFKKNLGKRHVRVNTIFELGSLHPEYFKKERLSFLKSKTINTKYALLRFVKWNAAHDFNENGLTLEEKKKIVNKLSKHLTVYISSESELPDDLKKYKIDISPEKMHQFLYNASIFIGESGTMGVESALLGTPSIMFSSSATKIGNFIELRDKYSLLIICQNIKELLNTSLTLINDPKSKVIWSNRSKTFIEDKINFTKFLLWFFNDYSYNVKSLLKRKEINSI
tara:strand:- start:10950 stop:12020 length:1071 start_codon:yes stop_codon:yes gene_type:complete